MIIGNGDVAKALKDIDRDDLIFFASGVSNSGEVPESEYIREKDLLFSLPKSTVFREDGERRRLVYFSSLCIYYSDTRYAKHKMEMEVLVKRNFHKNTIVRLGLIDWGDNPNTLINYLKNRLAKNLPFEIRDTVRYVLNEKEFVHWMSMIPDWNSEMNVTGKMMTIREIFDQYVK